MHAKEIQVFLDGLVKEAESRSLDRALSLNGLLSAGLIQTKAISPKAYRRLKNTLGQRARLAREHEEIAIRMTFERVMNSLGAQRSVLLFGSAAQELVDRMNDQISREAKQTLTHFRRVLLAAELMKAGHPMGDGVAVLKAAEVQAPRFKLIYQDSAGRKWRSQHYVKIQFQSSLYSLVNDVLARRLIDQGFGDATLYNPGSDSHGVTVDLTNIDSELLHEGSRALLVESLDLAA